MKNFNSIRSILVLFIISSVCLIHGISEDGTHIEVKRCKEAEQLNSNKQKNISFDTGICFQCGNGSDGVYSPTVNSDLPGGNYQFSSVNIPSGVIITITGSEPLFIQCTGTVVIDGIIRANGGAGGNGITFITFGTGGTGVAGGSNGGNGVYSASLGPLNGFPGGGTGGGQEGIGWSGGGGGGHLNNGSSSGGVGGNGGVSYGDPLSVELNGGSGGGGGSGGYSCGAGGGGAGGGIIVITSCISITIGSNGAIECKGGNGGSDGTGNCGAGGGGSGGSIRLNSALIINNGSLNVDGGIGGQSTVSYSPYFGQGGTGSSGRTQINIANQCCLVSVDQPDDQMVCNNTMTTTVSFTGSDPANTYNWTNNNSSIGLAASGTGDISSFTATNAGNTPVVATITVTPAIIAQSGSETFNYTGVVQTFTVPAGVTSINIDAKGAQGGNSNGGLGAQMTGTFSVTPGEVLEIVVGQQGIVNNCGGPNASGGGGGGSFVWKQADPFTPLLVAGGGGGGNTNWSGTCTSGIDASTSTAGTKGNGSLSAEGGTSGLGGFGNAPSGTGSGGTGWLSSGQNSTYGTGSTGGSTFPLFTGGNGSTNFGPGGEGGFGGGGGAVCGCGGGGGYSGGGGGDGSLCRAGGGGGGSFNSGTNQNNIAGVQTGNGQVIITYEVDQSCIGTSKTFIVTVNPTPTAEATAVQTCEGGSIGSINLTVSGGTPGYTYDWSNDGPETPDNDPKDLIGLNAGQYTVTVTDAGGCTAVTSAGISTLPLPCGWSAEPNGAGCAAGSSVAYNNTTQRFTVTSTNCYYPNSFTSDALAFAQYDLCGNGSITAQVTSITPLGQGWAGVTMRESNAAGAKKAQLMTNLSAFSRREFRTTTGAAAYPQQFPSQNRYWLRITRTGNQFAMYISQNGTSWSLNGTQTIVMGNCIEVGLVVTNYTANSTVTANFANVNVTGGNITKPTINAQEDILAAADFTIMPNPTTGIISLDLSSYGKRQVRLDMYNLQGKLLRSINIESVKGKEEVDLTTFASGMYLIRVRSEGLPDVTKRVVVNSNY